MSSGVRAWLLTGPPGIGKSTVVSRVIYQVRSKGFGVGGCLTKETRRGKERVGFTIVDLLSGVSGVLASSEGSLGPRVGRYRVNVRGLEEVGGGALRAAASQADLIAIDEVGPMELTSAEFRRGVEGCLSSGKPILAVVHEMMKDPLIEQIRELPGRELVEVTLHNRESLADLLSGQIIAVLTASSVGEGR